MVPLLNIDTIFPEMSPPCIKCQINFDAFCLFVIMKLSVFIFVKFNWSHLYKPRYRHLFFDSLFFKFSFTMNLILLHFMNVNYFGLLVLCRYLNDEFKLIINLIP